MGLPQHSGTPVTQWPCPRTSAAVSSCALSCWGRGWPLNRRCWSRKGLTSPCIFRQDLRGTGPTPHSRVSIAEGSLEVGAVAAAGRAPPDRSALSAGEGPVPLSCPWGAAPSQASAPLTLLGRDLGIWPRTLALWSWLPDVSLVLCGARDLAGLVPPVSAAPSFPLPPGAAAGAPPEGATGGRPGRDGPAAQEAG